jgi:hypothetical protein
MDAKELARLRALCEAATPGPWTEDDGFIHSAPLTAQRFDALRRTPTSRSPLGWPSPPCSTRWNG